MKKTTFNLFYRTALLVVLIAFSGFNTVLGQTSTQNFGTNSGSNTSQTASTSLIPTPTGTGTITTYARAGATAPNAPVYLATTSNPLGTTGAYVRAVASSSTSVTKFSPIVGYSGSTEFYTSFKVLFGNSTGGTTATSGSWTFAQGAGAFFSDNNAYSTSQTFAGLRFTYGASGAITLNYDNGSFTTSGLTSSSLSQGTIYTIEIIGNNKSSGTISYTYNGTSQTVAVQKYDLFINGSKIGDDLTWASISAGASISSITFTGISSTSNVANIFVDDVVTYNSVPANIGTASSTPTKLAITSITPTTPTAGSTFSVTVQAQDGSGNAGNVTNATAVSLSNTGGGTLGGTTTGTISAGASSVTISGVTLSSAATGVTLTASKTSGDDLSDGTSSTFNVLEAVPTAASAVTVGTRASTSIPISWTNGNGSNRIVVARLYSTTAVAPTAGTAYTANSTDFTDPLNSTTGTNNKVVYNGNGSSVTVTGLTAATAYNFDVYEYNGSTSTYNYASAASAGSTSTLATEPTSQPTSLTFTSVTATGMTIGCTGGNGTNRIFVVRQTGAVDFVPTDGTAYTANLNFSSGTGLGASSDNKVVAVSGTSAVVTGLTANTTYYVAVYELNGSSTTINYLTTSPLTGSKGTLAAAPTAATGLSATGKTSSSITLGWTNGTGAGRIVVARLSSGTSAVAPSGATTYTANSTSISDASNPTTGTGNVVVYNGTGNSVTVTGLSAATQYKFEVYEYNGSDVTSNYSSAVALGATYSLAADATTQASSVVFSNTTASGMTIGFTKGTGSNRIVLVKAGSAVDSDPVDATTYTANAAFGSGTQIGTGNYVVYSGSGTSVAVTGLSANTTYYVAVYEFNGSGSTLNYLTTTPATGSQITLVAAPSAPTALTFSSVTSNSLKVSYTAPASAPTGYLVLRKTSAISSGPVGGTEYTQGSDLGGSTIVYIGTTPWSNYDQTSLTDNTTYYYAVYSYSGSGTQTNYSTALTGSQLTASIDAPVASSATSVSSTGFTANWSALTGATGGYLLDVSTSATFGTSTPSTLTEGFESGLTAAYISNGTATLGSGVWSFVDGGYAGTANGTFRGTTCCQLKASTGIASTPALDNVTSISFWAKSSGTSMRVSKTVNGTTSTVSNLNITNTLTQYNVTVNDNSSGIVISFENTNLSNALYIDDVSIGYSTTNPSFLSGYNAKPILGQATVSADLTGLTSSTTYYYRVRAVGGNSTSSNSGTISVTTTRQNINLESGNYTSSAITNSAADVTVASGATLTIDASVAANSITVAPGGKVTVNDGKTLTAPVTLLSDSTGTASFVNYNISSSVTGTVQQYLTGTSSSVIPRGWWYVSSPISNAKADVFIPNGSSNKFGYWDEPSFGYPQITDNQTALTQGKGYVFNNNSADGIISFNGTLNNGNIRIQTTRTGTTDGARGFNLIGNPYPSYIDWSTVTKNNVRQTIWYRTWAKGGGGMTFDTFDGTVGTANGKRGAVSQYIPPMQGFWVKVNADGDTASVIFHNSDRLHRDQTAQTNRLRVPGESIMTPAIIRLSVSNGTNSDEVILVGDVNASNAFDNYDSPKMKVNNSEIPELYSIADQQELVINHLNSITNNTELPLGFRPGKTASFTIAATEISNLDSNLKLILKDNNNEYELTNGNSYSFSSDATATTSRFSIIFKSYSTVTSTANTNNNNAVISSNKMNGISITIQGDNNSAKAIVYDITGKELMSSTLKTGLNNLATMPAGVYIVRISTSTGTSDHKVVIK